MVLGQVKSTGDRSQISLVRLNVTIGEAFILCDL